MFQKNIQSKPKWGAQAVVREGTAPQAPPVATALKQYCITNYENISFTVHRHCDLLYIISAGSIVIIVFVFVLFQIC